MQDVPKAPSMEAVDPQIDVWVEATKKLTGKIVEERKPWIENINEENIRHFAQGTDDQNPLWLDAAIAAKTKWGGIIAPPSMISSTVFNTPTTAPNVASLPLLKRRRP